MSFCLGLNVLNGIIFIWRKHENMSPCTGNRVITSYERIASCAGTQFRSWASDTYLKNNNLFAPNFCTCQDISIVASCRKSGWKFSNQLKICEYKQNVFIILKEYIYEVSAKRPLLLDTQRVFTNYNKKKTLAQLEHLCSEDTPCCPWLPIQLSSSYWIPSQNKTKWNLQNN